MIQFCLRDQQSKVVIVALDIVMFATNGFASLIVARGLGPDRYATYVAITSLVGVASLASLSVQASAAAIHSVTPAPLLQTESYNFWFGSGERKAIQTGFTLSALWIISLPLATHYLDTSFTFLLLAVPTLIVGSLGSLYSGRLQGREEFITWRSFLTIATTSQLIIVAVILQLNSIHLLIAVLPLPTVFFICITHLKLRGIKCRSIEAGMTIRLGPSIAVIAVALGSNLPLVLIRRSPTDYDLGSLALLFYSFSVVVGIGTTLGSILLPKFVQRKSKGNSVISWKNHFANAGLIFPIFIVYLFFGPDLMGLYFQKTPAETLSPVTSSLIVFSCFIWGTNVSAMQESMSEIRMRPAFCLLAWTFLEIVILLTCSPNLDSYFLVHIVSGIFMLWLVRRLN